MKKISLIIAFASILFVSCSSYGVKNEINKSGQIKKLEKIGIIIRTPKASMLTNSEVLLSIKKWSGAYKEKKELVYLSQEEMSAEVYTYDSALGPFVQLDESKSFMKFKTVGVVNMFLRTHSVELKSIMEKKGLDGLVIFEVDGFYSQELQWTVIYSMTVMTDGELDILFLDRQQKSKDVNEMVGDKVKALVLNDIGGRFVTMLRDMGCIEE
jgi:hypothetical protein